MDRVSIDSLNIIGTYTLKSGKQTDDECKLCRQNILAPSFDDIQNGNVKVTVSEGSCGHAFHKSCIDAHNNNNNNSCPIDKTPWDKKRDINLTGLIKTI
jgi:hypothetical protein